MNAKILLAGCSIATAIALEGTMPANAAPMADTMESDTPVTGSQDSGSSAGGNNPAAGNSATTKSNGSKCAHTDAYGYCLDANGKRIEKANNLTPPAADPKAIPEVDRTNK